MTHRLLLGLLLAVDSPMPSSEVETDLKGTTWAFEFKPNHHHDDADKFSVC